MNRFLWLTKKRRCIVHYDTPSSFILVKNYSYKAPLLFGKKADTKKNLLNWAVLIISSLFMVQIYK